MSGGPGRGGGGREGLVPGQAPLTSEEGAEVEYAGVAVPLQQAGGRGGAVGAQGAAHLPVDLTLAQALGPQPSRPELEPQAGGHVLEQLLRVVELLLVGELGGAGEGHQLGLRGLRGKAGGPVQEHAAGAPDRLLQHRAALVHDGHVQGPQAGLCVQAGLWAGGPHQWGAGLRLRWGLPDLGGWTCVWGKRPELAPAPPAPPSPPSSPHPLAPHLSSGPGAVTWGWGPPPQRTEVPVPQQAAPGLRTAVGQLY